MDTKSMYHFGDFSVLCRLHFRIGPVVCIGVPGIGSIMKSRERTSRDFFGFMKFTPFFMSQCRVKYRCEGNVDTLEVSRMIDDYTPVEGWNDIRAAMLEDERREMRERELLEMRYSEVAGLYAETSPQYDTMVHEDIWNKGGLFEKKQMAVAFFTVGSYARDLLAMQKKANDYGMTLPETDTSVVVPQVFEYAKDGSLAFLDMAASDRYVRENVLPSGVVNGQSKAEFRAKLAEEHLHLTDIMDDIEAIQYGD